MVIAPAQRERRNPKPKGLNDIGSALMPGNFRLIVGR